VPRVRVALVGPGRRGLVLLQLVLHQLVVVVVVVDGALVTVVVVGVSGGMGVGIRAVRRSGFARALSTVVPAAGGRGVLQGCGRRGRRGGLLGLVLTEFQGGPPAPVPSSAPLVGLLTLAATAAAPTSFPAAAPAASAAATTSAAAATTSAAAAATVPLHRVVLALRHPLEAVLRLRAARLLPLLPGGAAFVVALATLPAGARSRSRVLGLMSGGLLLLLLLLLLLWMSVAGPALAGVGMVMGGRRLRGRPARLSRDVLGVHQLLVRQGRVGVGGL